MLAGYFSPRTRDDERRSVTRQVLTHLGKFDGACKNPNRDHPRAINPRYSVRFLFSFRTRIPRIGALSVCLSFSRHHIKSSTGEFIATRRIEWHGLEVSAGFDFFVEKMISFKMIYIKVSIGINLFVLENIKSNICTRIEMNLMIQIMRYKERIFSIINVTEQCVEMII